MKIECILRRQTATRVILDSTEYIFVTLSDGAQVAEVSRSDHQAKLLAISNVYRQYTGNALMVVSTADGSQLDFTNAPNALAYNSDGSRRFQMDKVGSSNYTPRVSKYDKILIFPSPPRQSNAVKGLTLYPNDAQYVGAITDAEVYDTEAGALSVGMATTKALAFPWQLCQWDLSQGQSLLIQARVKTVGATTSSNVLFGNSDATVEGFGVVLYGPTHTTNAGKMMFNFLANGQVAQAIQIQSARVSGSSVVQDVLPTDTFLNLTIHVDGLTKVLSAYVNGIQGVNSGINTLNNGVSIPATGKRNFGLGYIPADDGFTSSAAKAARFQAFRMAVLPAGQQFRDVGMLDYLFNENPRRLFSDVDYLGV